MLTLKSVNKQVSKSFPGYELVKGEGYFYVVGPATESLYSDMIYAYRLNHLTMEQWISSVASVLEKKL